MNTQDLQDGESFFMKGSGAKPYELKNSGGVYSCTCPAWRNQSLPIERRTCKHLRKLRGDQAEAERTATAVPPAAAAEASPVEPPPLLLAQNWDTVQDVTGWWLSEKLDGVRAYWDGHRLLSRQGNEFHAPEWFLRGLPAVPLDGELWVGRKQFQQTVGIVRRQDRSDHWRAIRYLVFDAPRQAGGFEERMTVLKDLVSGLGRGPVELHQQSRCLSVTHVHQELDRIHALGGEGLMLRQPASPYEVGRSSTLLKVKRFHDAEAVVIGYESGKGKHRGRTGSLRVQLPDGVEFSVGTGLTDAERENPPAPGSVITFRYQEFSDGGVPRFPSYMRVRQDCVAPSPKPSKQAMKPTPKAKANPATASVRRFEFVDGVSSKFWEVGLKGSNLTTRWGRIGANGQEKVKRFADADSAAKEQAALIAEKTGKGYREV